MSPAADFCTRCGLDLRAAAVADEPLRLRAGGVDVTVGGLLRHGDVANLYHCTVAGRRGVFKIARTPAANVHLAREAATLARLHRDGRLAPFLPRVAGETGYVGPDAEPTPRRANVLTYHDKITSPDELYSLAEVRRAYPAGLDARDAAWMWRRLLAALDLVHAARIAHADVSADHVLIEPRDHKLVLIGWCNATSFGGIPPLAARRDAASPRLDLASAARVLSGTLAAGAEPAIVRHLERAAGSTDAARLLLDFDRLIESLWGPRQFRPFAMPPRG